MRAYLERGDRRAELIVDESEIVDDLLLVDQLFVESLLVLKDVLWDDARHVLQA